MSDRPGSVLFACNFNAVRSPMAEGIAKKLFGTEIYIQSVGVRPDGELDPFTVSVLAEIDIDIAAHDPKTFDDLDDSSFDLVITLTPEAQHKAVEMTRTMAVEVEYWPTFDPTMTLGSRDVILASYRQVRDDLTARIKRRLGPRDASRN